MKLADYSRKMKARVKLRTWLKSHGPREQTSKADQTTVQFQASLENRFLIETLYVFCKLPNRNRHATTSDKILLRPQQQLARSLITL